MIIQPLVGPGIDISDYSLKRLFHRIPSPEIEHGISSVNGRADIVTETKLNNRIITVDFLYQVSDIYDFYLLRDRLNSIFTTDQPFYIIFKRERYKRWKVRLARQFQIEPNSKMQTFTVEFLTDNAYAESIYRTVDFTKTWDSGQHAWDGLINWDDSPPSYVHNTNNFIINNLGDKKIDPREDDLEIIVKGQFNEFVRIINSTTGEIYQYNKGLSSTDELKISKVRTLINSNSDFASTNKKLITLAPGANNITVEGGTIDTISFDFRYLFK